MRFDTAFLNIGACRACNQCYSKHDACIFNDDFNQIAKELENADGIVFVTPVYWFSFPAQIKAFIDRLYSMYSGGKTFANKKCALIACCEADELSTFDGIKFAYEQTVELMNGESVAELLIPSVLEIGDIKKTKGEELATQLAGKFL